jgi:hypothetical protein
MLCSYGISDYWIYGIFLEKNETVSDGMDTSGQWQVEQLNHSQLHLKSRGATQTIAVIDSGGKQPFRFYRISPFHFSYQVHMYAIL